MISDKDINELITQVNDFWNKLLSTKQKQQEFYDIAKGKEGGHQLSDKVDEITTAVIQTRWPFRSGYQKKNGKKSARSMGDIWFKNEEEEWNPINVKTGLIGSEGQPNIVSLKRLMDSIMDHTIDSYYILLIKFKLDTKLKKITHTVHLTDILDWLNLSNGESVITFNSGPGQTMLKAKKFYELLTQNQLPEKLNVTTKMKRLMDLYKLGEENLKKDREKDFNKFTVRYNKFTKLSENNQFRINKDNQIKLGIE